MGRTAARAWATVAAASGEAAWRFTPRESKRMLITDPSGAIVDCAAFPPTAAGTGNSAGLKLANAPDAPGCRDDVGPFALPPDVPFAEREFFAAFFDMLILPL